MKCVKCAYQTIFNPDVVVYSKGQRKAGLCWGHYQEAKASPQARTERSSLPHSDLDTIDEDHDLGIRDLTDPFTGQ